MSKEEYNLEGRSGECGRSAVGRGSREQTWIACGFMSDKA